MKVRNGTAGVRHGLRLLLLVALALALAAACNPAGDEDARTPGGIVITVTSPTPTRATPPPTATTTPTPTPSETPLRVCSFNPDPAPPSLLQVVEPQPQAEVKVPIHVRGWGSNIGFQDAGVAIALVDERQTVLQVLNRVPPQPRANRVVPPGLEITDFTRPFAADLIITGVTKPTPFCIWVYLETAEDGTARGVVLVPVLVVP